jgi:hypothetical protein
MEYNGRSTVKRIENIIVERERLSNDARMMIMMKIWILGVGLDVSIMSLDCMVKCKHVSFQFF